MIRSKLFYKLINEEYGNLTFEEIVVIDRYRNIFGKNSKLWALINEKDKSILFKEDDEGNKILLEENIDIIKRKIPDKYLLLEKFDNNCISYNDININLKEEYIEALNRLDIYRLCLFIDYIFVYIKDKKLYFFGKYYDIANVFHEINRTVSKSFGLHYVFEVFGKNKNIFMKLDYERFNRNELIKCLEIYSKNYLYILIEIANILAEVSNEELEKVKGVTQAINKSTKIYVDILTKEKKKIGRVITEQVGTISSEMIE